MVLECIKNIYKKDECNYFILESQNILLYSLDDTSIKIHLRTQDLQVFIHSWEIFISSILRLLVVMFVFRYCYKYEIYYSKSKFVEILEFIAFNMKFVPCKELVSIGLTIQNYKYA